ncbi:FkbM family methyltransferase [Peptoanaerobacter stomatis]|uniref:FkbM family methyltransferase n=1 Tax=Peptoanaerobacter stomatis TaxID=796937 RepID=UPI003F9EFA06
MKTSEKLKIKIRQKKDIYKYKKIILWGAGFALDDCIDSIGKDKISAVFDNDPEKWNKNIMGFEIQESKYLNKYYDEDTAVVISTNGYEYEIAKYLIENGVLKNSLFGNSNQVVENYRYLPSIIDDNYDNIMQVKEWLYDEYSKEYYINFIKACLSRNPLFYKDNPLAFGIYGYKTDIDVEVSKGAIIVDCGAFIGDSARIFMNKTDNDCTIYCFEPVKENYNKLREWVEKDNLKNIFPINSGVGASKYEDNVYSTEEVTTKAAVGMNRFEAEKPVVSKINVDTIDNMIKGKVDYIKMDIEGFEMQALYGAQNTIKNNNPKMLISAYHKVTDMWEIPQYVKKINSNYKIILTHQPHAPYEPEFIFVV